MKNINLNDIPIFIKEQKITKEEGTNFILKFISENYLVFGKNLYDEDLRSEVIIKVLEKIETLFNNYDENQGSFFTYLFSFIQNTILTFTKQKNRKIILEQVSQREWEQKCIELTEKYQLKPLLFSENKIPYSSKKINSDNLKKYCTEIAKSKNKTEKILLTLALKNCFYLTDNLIVKIAKYLNIDVQILSDLILYYKSEMNHKIQKKLNFEEKRDKAYYSHKKNEKEIEVLKEKQKFDFNTNSLYSSNAKLEKLYQVNKKHINNWENLNKKFTKGTFSVRPPNHLIADILGICERQVSYYLFCAKNGKTDFSEIQKKIEDFEED